MNTAIPMAYAISLHCVKVSKYGVFSGPYFFVFGLNTEISKSPYSVRIQENTSLKKLCIWTLLTQCRHKYLQDYRRPSSSCKSNKEWSHIALPYYNERGKEIFYLQWLIADRLIRSRLMSLWNVWSYL